MPEEQNLAGVVEMCRWCNRLPRRPNNPYCSEKCENESNDEMAYEFHDFERLPKEWTEPRRE